MAEASGWCAKAAERSPDCPDQLHGTSRPPKLGTGHRGFNTNTRKGPRLRPRVAHTQSRRASHYVHASIAGGFTIPGDPAQIDLASYADQLADALLKVARDVDAALIVVGSRGMHGAKRVLGSVPNTVSHQAPCNVLIVSTDQP